MVFGMTQHTGGEMVWCLALSGPCVSSYASSLFPSTAFSNLVQFQNVASLLSYFLWVGTDIHTKVNV